jgi:hypothetical protein
MRTEIMIHGARPTLHRAGATLWLSLNLTAPSANPTEPSASLTLFFDQPDDVAALGQTLIAQAEVARRVLMLEAEVVMKAAP